MPPRTNHLGLPRNEYKGRPSTLCPGCGHDSISNQIISMAYELGLEQHKIIKISGIGCSSKTPAYFLGGSHGFNALHGRMPSVVTGALLANTDLECIAVSGDGDSGSIGMGQFKHVIRRNVPFTYIIENNGVYGLTKGQFSATADEGQFLKYYGTNHMPPIDLALEAVIAGATFVARSFSGDAKQVQTLLQAAVRHHGDSRRCWISSAPASPSTMPRRRLDQELSLSTMAGITKIPLHEIQILAPDDYVDAKEEITIDDYDEGDIIDVEMHDGSYLRLKKLDNDHDPRKWAAAGYGCAGTFNA